LARRAGRKRMARRKKVDGMYLNRRKVEVVHVLDAVEKASLETFPNSEKEVQELKERLYDHLFGEWSIDDDGVLDTPLGSFVFVPCSVMEAGGFWKEVGEDLHC